MILLIAAVLRLWGLGQKSLWLDESVTVHNASAPYSVMIHNLKKFDVHPPLFQTVQWAWMRFGSTLDEVIAAINEHEYGNGASIYTQNGYWARKFKMETLAGMIGINIGIPAPVPYLPFGGMKSSILANIKVQSKEVVNFFTEMKIVTERYWPEDDV
jgi:hypothetical protein